MNDTRIAAGTTVGSVRMTVSDLQRSIAFYSDAVGLTLREREENAAALGAGDEVLLVLEEHPGAAPVHSYAGLFHLAILLPDRTSLGRWLVHALRDGVPIDGASDHTVSEALYLSDPDGHGIEIYRDRPRSEWENRVGEVMGNAPLDDQGLLEIGGPQEVPYPGMPDATTMGHVHLQVTDIGSTVDFYSNVLGFEVTAMWDSAAFMSAGGYHHHIGANVWNSRGKGTAPSGSAALRSATIEVVDMSELDRLESRLGCAGVDWVRNGESLETTDPSGIALRVEVRERRGSRDG